MTNKRCFAPLLALLPLLAAACADPRPAPELDLDADAAIEGTARDDARVSSEEGQDAVNHYFCNYLYSLLPRPGCERGIHCQPTSNQGTLSTITTSVYWCCEFEVCGEQRVEQTTLDGGCC